MTVGDRAETSARNTRESMELVQGVVATHLDFSTKTERAIRPEDARSVAGADQFVWVDVDLARATDPKAILDCVHEIDPEIVVDVLSGTPGMQLAKYEFYFHIVVTGCRVSGDRFDLERVDLIVGEGFLITLHRGGVGFLDVVRRHYRADFQRFARSPSFLVYEIFDHLIENYLRVQKRFEERVLRVQSELIRNVDDQLFAQMSDLGSDLLNFRKILLPARELLTELSTRKSLFISEATQEFLGNMVGMVERVLQDLLADRDILSDSLNLHMSIMGHRTNRVMNRLTVVSVIFLPLTFLCGVYGMNFEVPETRWRYGYAFFWIMAISIGTVLVWFMRRKKLL